MRFPITKSQAKVIAQGLAIVVVGVMVIGGAIGMAALLDESARISQERAYQSGLNNGMIECRLRPDECDARFEAWEAQEALNKLLEEPE